MSITIILIVAVIFGITLLIGAFVWTKIRQADRPDLTETKPGRKHE